MAWSPLRRANAGISWVRKPGDYANLFPPLPGRHHSHLTGGIKWINSGTTQLGVDYLPFIRYYIPTNEITLTPGAGDQIVIENEPGASLTVLGGGAAINGPSDGSAMLYNYGTIDNDTGYGGGGSSSISIEVNVVNDGLLETPFVGYDLSGALTGTGTTDVGAGTEINGSVGVGQTLQFRNNLVETVAGYSYSTLTLGNVLQFEGSISGFDQNGVANDAIVVDAVTGAWAYQGFVANSGGTGGSLMFTNGSAEAVVHLSGSYDPNDFQSLVSGYQTAIFYNG
jgi:hypothetical protein